MIRTKKKQEADKTDFAVMLATALTGERPKLSTPLSESRQYRKKPLTNLGGDYTKFTFLPDIKEDDFTQEDAYVLQFSSRGFNKHLYTYSSLEEAAKFMTGKYPYPKLDYKEEIDLACRSGSSLRSSLWRYMPPEVVESLQAKKEKEMASLPEIKLYRDYRLKDLLVLQFDQETFEHLNTYTSQSQAAKALKDTNISYNGTKISNACKSGDAALGYLWRFMLKSEYEAFFPCC